MSLSGEFAKLLKRTLDYQTERRNTTELHAQHHVKHIFILLVSIPIIAKTTPKPNIEVFVKQNKGNIYRVYYILANETKMYISDKSRRTDLARKVLHLMHVLLINNVKQFFERLPTDYLTEFCKGITYFSGEVITERPFYHRESSCGTGKLTASQKFLSKRTVTESPSHQAIKAKVRKCYLERTIYDQIYNDILHYQDLPHFAELRKMERYYQDNYNERRITALIYYRNQIEPESLIITTFGDAVGDKIEEHYEKTASKVVKCTKRVFKDNVLVAFFSKEQTEDLETMWIEAKQITMRVKGGKSSKAKPNV